MTRIIDEASCYLKSEPDVRYASACRVPARDAFAATRQAEEALAKVDARKAATTLEPGATATGPSQKLEFTRESDRSLSLPVPKWSQSSSFFSRRTAFLQEPLKHIGHLRFEIGFV